MPNKKMEHFASRRMFVLYTVFLVAHRVINVLMPSITQRIVDAISAGSMERIQFYGILDLGLVVLFMLFLSLGNYVQKCYENGKILIEKKEFMTRINEIPYTRFQKRGSGYYLQRFNSDIESCRPFLLEKKVKFWV